MKILSKRLEIYIENIQSYRRYYLKVSSMPSYHDEHLSDNENETVQLYTVVTVVYKLPLYYVLYFLSSIA
jgi:hypothetical protein